MTDNKQKITVSDIDNSPSTSVPSETDVVVTVGALIARLTEVSEEKIQLQQENEILKSKAETTKILDDLIEPYAKRTFIFMCVYCGFVGLALTANALGYFQNIIAPEVLQILVGSTAVTVIGLVGMVLTGIFVGARPKS